MDFYSRISKYYDLIFPVSEEQERFFAEIVRDFKPAKVLDAACGSGSQLLCFAKRGVKACGFDADPEMVGLAREKLKNYPDAEVKRGVFAEMTRLFPPGFDLVMNIGNSLVHVPKGEAKKFIQDAATMLSPNGILLIQILNYERIFRERIEELPVITVNEGELTFHRKYEFTSNEKVIFRTTIEVPSERIRIENSIPLYPMTAEELVSATREAGLSVMSIHPGFVGRKFTPDSEAVVLLAKK
ncbi:MAG: class I SAM-dependent methyltransferase [Deltaproteobacteria bacterium]|nr:MAG: class I SAM-dependent methyltransferase [Deltaproteobacteria bacterium]